MSGDSQAILLNLSCLYDGFRTVFFIRSSRFHSWNDDKKRKVYLPDNHKGWYDVDSDKYDAGGTELEVDAPIDVIPKFAQAGSVIPIRDGEITFHNKNDEERGLLIYPTIGDGRGQASIYEDDGESLEYQNGQFAYIHVQMETTDEKVEQTISVDGKYRPPYNRMTLTFPEHEKRTILVNKQKLEFNQPFTWSME